MKYLETYDKFNDEMKYFVIRFLRLPGQTKRQYLSTNGGFINY